jgi:hypothetical protein
MTSPGRTSLWLAASVSFVFLFSVPLFAQGSSSTTALAAGRASPPPLPVMPTLKSPVNFFRELLAMTPVERRQSLTNRPPETRKRILAKLREYESLKPDERELRLRATELQWYLLPLMSVSRTNRTARLALIPAEQRPLVEERLDRWDLLPPALQEELLNSETTARYFTQFESATAEQRQNILSRMSPERRTKLEAGIDRWRGLSEEQRRKTLARFDAFFELTPQEKQKALNSLSEAELRQMEKTLQVYSKLPAAQRVQCLHSFEKFAGMSLAERQTFLKNAERWKLMPPAEREAWRRLVRLAPLQPPSPSRANTPPLPPALQRRTAVSVATN